MTRERRIVETLVELANGLVADFDVVEFLHHVSVRCVELLDCAEAGLLIVEPAGALRVMASSSERSEALELLQVQHEEGPCFESHLRGEQVFSEDLAAAGDRWPRFTPLAVEKGFRSVQALPMRVGAETIGTLNLFRTATGRIEADDLSLAQGMADIAAGALMRERSLRETRSVVGQLQGALRSRVIIEQAKGAVAERAQIDVEAAFGRLRGHARAHNRRLSDVAWEIIDGRLDADALDAPTREASTER